jgi:hypothetical protein
MRKIYVVDREHPPTEEDLSAAAGAGAPEVICGIPSSLTAQGINIFG